MIDPLASLRVECGNSAEALRIYEQLRRARVRRLAGRKHGEAPGAARAVPVSAAPFIAQLHPPRQASQRHEQLPSPHVYPTHAARSARAERLGTGRHVGEAACAVPVCVCCCVVGGPGVLAARRRGSSRRITGRGGAAVWAAIWFSAGVGVVGAGGVRVRVWRRVRRGGVGGVVRRCVGLRRCCRGR